RPWDGVTVWDGVTTNPDDFPDFDDLAAEQMAGMAEGFLDADAGRVRDGKLVMQEMRERLARGEFNPHPPAQSGREYRNGK
ncbi:MAG: hypothetical protein H7Y38_12385, partial [Armatimonadetes bacterium]|nr:hypothetical protein [Armatimonadota bacterium]